VVCPTEAEKNTLVQKMKDAGMTEYNGRLISEFVRVETHFFDY